jgi:hypothetical protein
MELSFLYAAHATYGPMHQYVLTQKFFSLPILMSSPFRHNKGRQTSDEPKTLKKSALSAAFVRS